MQVNKAYIQDWKEKWEEYWETLDQEGKECFGVTEGPPSEKFYEHCFRCSGTYKDFTDADDDDLPNGSTITSILDRDE